jgi:FkbM family methyltransferase
MWSPFIPTALLGWPRRGEPVSRGSRRFLARHRRNPAVAYLARKARSFLRGYDNFDYDPHCNGERFLLQQIAAAGADTLFDVGANRGEWTLLARTCCPQAEIHAFEIVPRTCERLVRAAAPLAGVRINDFGLSDRDGMMPVAVTDDDTRATTVAGFLPEASVLPCRVRRGDDYAADCGIARIDLLKIDVEGGEFEVLRGFERMLQQGQIGAIQFEYGTALIYRRLYLRDFYELLDGFGFASGKLYPGHVVFQPYRVELEDFLGPNYVAVHKTRDALRRRLAG